MRRLLVATVGMTAVVSVGCGGRTDAQVLVSAAASLHDAFRAIEAAFEDAHPDLDLIVNVAGTASLREQILEGAPVDVFASADADNMDRVVAAGRVADDPVVFVTNRLQLVVPAGNPGGVTGLADLARPELLVGLCAVTVPCGDFAQLALSRAGVTAAVDTYEADVRALVTKLEAGELDAGIVYASDVRASGGTVEGIDLPPGHQVVAEYPVAVVADAPNPAGARAFVEFLLSPAAGRILRDFGFMTP